MSIVHYLGADVAKDTIELHAETIKLPKQITNNAAGLARLVKVCAGQRVHLVCEATGAYHRALREACAGADIPLTIANPAQIRAFAKGKGRHAKTDRLDAYVLWLFGQGETPAPTPPPTQTEQAMAAWSARRAQLLTMRAQEKNRRQVPGLSPIMLAAINEHLAFLNRQLTVCDQALAAVVAASATLTHQVNLLTQVSGVGPTTAITLLAVMPELGTLNKRAVARLAGLAPLDRSSGKHLPPGHIGGGRLPVRRALFMAAFSARQHDPRLRAFYEHLRAKGKPYRLCLTAVMRKLLIRLNAIIKTHPLTPQKNT